MDLAKVSTTRTKSWALWGLLAQVCAVASGCQVAVPVVYGTVALARVAEQLHGPSERVVERRSIGDVDATDVLPAGELFYVPESVRATSNDSRERSVDLIIQGHVAVEERQEEATFELFAKLYCGKNNLAIVEERTRNSSGTTLDYKVFTPGLAIAPDTQHPERGWGKVISTICSQDIKPTGPVLANPKTLNFYAGPVKSSGGFYRDGDLVVVAVGMDEIEAGRVATLKIGNQDLLSTTRCPSGPIVIEYDLAPAVPRERKSIDPYDPVKQERGLLEPAWGKAVKAICAAGK